MISSAAIAAFASSRWQFPVFGMRRIGRIPFSAVLNDPSVPFRRSVQLLLFVLLLFFSFSFFSSLFGLFAFALPFSLPLPLLFSFLLLFSFFLFFAFSFTLLFALIVFGRFRRGRSVFFFDAGATLRTWRGFFGAQFFRNERLLDFDGRGFGFFAWTCRRRGFVFDGFRFLRFVSLSRFGRTLFGFRFVLRTTYGFR